MFLQVNHINSNCRKNVSYSGHSYQSMANCGKSRFSLNSQSFPVVLKSAPVKYIATYCPWESHQIHSSCTSMSLWWQNNPSLWLSWTVSIPKWVSILWHAACAQSDAKLLEGGVYDVRYICHHRLWLRSVTQSLSSYYSKKCWPLCGADIMAACMELFKSMSSIMWSGQNGCYFSEDMHFLFAIFHLYLFIKHIVLHCIKVAQNMRVNFSCHTDRDAELSICYNGVFCLTL